MTAVNSVIQEIFWLLAQPMCKVFGKISGCNLCCDIFCGCAEEIFGPYRVLL